MKKCIAIMLLLCMLLNGCGNAGNQPAQSTEPVQTETKAEEPAATLIRPLPDTTMEALENSTVNISFTQEDFYRNESGKVFLRMQIYTYDKFDMVDISLLKAGDIILISGEELPVNTIARNDYGTVLINGGLDEGGLDLATDDGGIYYEQGYSDMKSWYLVGEAECEVSDTFAFHDSADLEQGAIVYSAEDLLNNVPVSIFGYQPQNTTVRLENGQVVAMERIYTP